LFQKKGDSVSLLVDPVFWLGQECTDIFIDTTDKCKNTQHMGKYVCMSDFSSYIRMYSSSDSLIENYKKLRFTNF